MPYAELVEALSEAPSLAVTAFPDGNVDRRYRVHEGGGEVPSRRSFGGRIAGAADDFDLVTDGVEPGGQATNMAQQAAALGVEATLLGHLDAPIFGDLDFETVSMGDPARVELLRFDDGDLMLVEDPESHTAWGVDDLDAAAAAADGEPYAADAVCCGNWASFPEMTATLAELADRLACDVFVLDPGGVTGIDASAAAGLSDALATLDSACDAIVSVNRREARALAAAVDESGGNPIDRIRRAADLTGVALHGEDAAVAATPEGSHHVPSVDVADPVRDAGAGDRFSAGLAYGLATGWGWERALAAANACSTYFVEYGETATPGRLPAYLRNRGATDGA